MRSKDPAKETTFHVSFGLHSWSNRGNMNSSMHPNLVFLSLSLLIFTNGVFGVVTEDVLVMEGDSITLKTGIEKQKSDRIAWYFGPENILIAQINGKADSSVIYGSIARRGELDSKSGSLNITNISTTDSGLYNVKITSKNRVSYKTFNVTVHAVLPVPVIIRNSSQCSSSYGNSSVTKCLLQCSVVNVHHVTLSWYKGNSLISSVSVFDLSISLSLPLEVEHQDKNTYSCVLNNNISKKTKHLDPDEHCQPCSCFSPVLLILVPLLAVVPLILGAVIYFRKHRRGYQKATLMKCGHTEAVLTIKEREHKIQQQV